LTKNIAATLIDAAEQAGGFDTFLSVVREAGLESLLAGAAKHTVFAPTDEAFAKFPQATLDKLAAPEQRELLTAVVSMHLVAGQVRTERLKGKRIRGKSVQGGELVINGADAVTVNGAVIVRPDISAANGVLHGIDRVLWPKLARDQSEAAVSG
jgi:uncharacterized surface protein with fasciclin (FAS1) repeats